ncbi:hypothetical protein DFH06DRAFT_1147348 [Mycena polygramma]|nr:hypothetical protein DFH06DRAFT_1147348 [Mycena polygramma]
MAWQKFGTEGTGEGYETHERLRRTPARGTSKNRILDPSGLNVERCGRAAPTTTHCSSRRHLPAGGRKFSKKEVKKVAARGASIHRLGVIGAAARRLRGTLTITTTALGRGTRRIAGGGPTCLPAAKIFQKRGEKAALGRGTRRNKRVDGGVPAGGQKLLKKGLKKRKFGLQGRAKGKLGEEEGRKGDGGGGGMEGRSERRVVVRIQRGIGLSQTSERWCFMDFYPNEDPDFLRPPDSDFPLLPFSLRMAVR